MKKLLICIVIALMSIDIYADASLSDGWKFNGYGVIIPYLDGRDFSNETHPLYYSTMKLRFGVEKEMGNFLFKMQIQNSRIFGEEASITSNKNPIFIIDGYLKYDSILNVPLSLQAGRFQMDYSTGRFMAVSPWNYIERAYDGFRFSYHKPNIFLDIFAVKHTTLLVPPPFNAIPGAYLYPEKNYNDYDILGFWYQNKMGDKKSEAGAHEFNIFTYWEADAKKADTTNLNLNRFTSGITYIWDFSNFKTIAELGYQYGTKGALDVASYLASLSLSYKTGDYNFKMGDDIYSGTAAGTKNEINTFDNYLASKHRFYGLMDYFSNARNNYGGLGLNDFYFGVDYNIAKDWKINLTSHYFTSNQKSVSDLSDYGSEFDLAIRYNIRYGLFVEWLNGIFLPGDLMKEFYRTPLKDRVDPGFSSSLRFSVKI